MRPTGIPAAKEMKHKQLQEDKSIRNSFLGDKVRTQQTLSTTERSLSLCFTRYVIRLIMKPAHKGIVFKTQLVYMCISHAVKSFP